VPCNNSCRARPPSGSPSPLTHSLPPTLHSQGMTVRVPAGRFPLSTGCAPRPPRRPACPRQPRVAGAQLWVVASPAADSPSAAPLSAGKFGELEHRGDLASPDHFVLAARREAELYKPRTPASPWPGVLASPGDEEVVPVTRGRAACLAQRAPACAHACDQQASQTCDCGPSFPPPSPPLPPPPSLSLPCPLSPPPPPFAIVCWHFLASARLAPPKTRQLGGGRAVSSQVLSPLLALQST